MQGIGTVIASLSVRFQITEYLVLYISDAGLKFPNRTSTFLYDSLGENRFI